MDRKLKIIFGISLLVGGLFSIVLIISGLKSSLFSFANLSVQSSGSAGTFTNLIFTNATGTNLTVNSLAVDPRNVAVDPTSYGTAFNSFAINTTDTNPIGNYLDAVYSLNSSSTASLQGNFFTVSNSGSGATSSIGVLTSIWNSAGNVVAGAHVQTLIAHNSRAFTQNGSVTDDAIGERVYFQGFNAGDQIKRAIGLYALPFVGSASPSSSYAILSENPGKGNVQWNIYANGGNNAFTSSTSFGKYTAASTTVDIFGAIRVSATSTASNQPLLAVEDLAGGNILSVATSTVGLAGTTYGPLPHAILGNSTSPGILEITPNGGIIIRNDATNGYGTFLGPGSLTLVNSAHSVTSTFDSNGIVFDATSGFLGGKFSVDSSGNTSVSGTLTVGGGSVKSIFRATSISFGNAILAAGGCTSTKTTVTGAQGGMIAEVDAQTYPGDGVYYGATITNPNEVTTKVCAVIPLTPTATTYNIAVIQ